MLTTDTQWALQGSNLRPPPCKGDWGDFLTCVPPRKRWPSPEPC